jgi:hypothetical protein
MKAFAVGRYFDAQRVDSFRHGEHILVTGL